MANGVLPEIREDILKRLGPNARYLSEEERVLIGINQPLPPPPGFFGRLAESGSRLLARRALRDIYQQDKIAEVDPSAIDLPPGDATVYGWYERQLRFQDDRREVYRIVEEMDNFSIINGALEVYAEDSTQPDYDDGQGKRIWIESDDAEVRNMGNAFLEKVQADEALPAQARGISKYGDGFEQALYGADGIVALDYVHPSRLSRVQTREGVLAGFVPGIVSETDLHSPGFSDRCKEKNEMSKPWDFLHGRNLGMRRDTFHGTSILMGARRAWRQDAMCEDAVSHYRLASSPSRLVFKVDVGSATPEQQYAIVERWRKAYSKKQVLDPATGFYRADYNPRDVDASIWWPTRTGSLSDVTQLAGGGDPGEMLDVAHFRDMLFAALRVPKAYLGFEGDVNAKATLTTQDVRFARGVKRIQAATISMWTQAVRIHFALKKGREFAKRPFKVRMASVSFLDDLQRSEVFKMRSELINSMAELGDRMGLDKKRWGHHLLVRFMGLTATQVRALAPGSEPNPDDEKDGKEGAPHGEIEPLPEPETPTIGGEKAGILNDAIACGAKERHLPALAAALAEHAVAVTLSDIERPTQAAGARYNPDELPEVEATAGGTAAQNWLFESEQRAEAAAAKRNRK